MKTLSYERIKSDELWKAFGLADGEFVINRSAFRWKKNGEVIRNAYEMLEMETICEERDWEIVERYGDSIAICTDLKASTV